MRTRRNEFGEVVRVWTKSERAAEAKALADYQAQQARIAAASKAAGEAWVARQAAGKVQS
jgi:hypothetical protein